MKLHAIEVTNLNSLYGTQSVNLDDDLKGASLFLIRGPTGSGKSTLMDAVSLALFATTPRLGHLRSSTAVAEQIMSRGKGACAAQVEFSKLEMGKRVRYRARWAARRSREKPDGNMQAVHRSLEKLQADGTWKTEVSDHRDKFTDPVFNKVLEGFSTSDFQRSMLLAQGQFDAMLHASASERASILERLTDTSDYQRIGELAYRMNKAWGGRISKLKTTVEAISPVSEEELEAARTAVEDGAVVLTDLSASVRSVEGQQRWLADSERCAKQAEEVAQAKAALVEQEASAAPQLQALAEAERCRSGLELLADEESALVRRGKAQERLEASQAAVPELVERLRLATEAAERAEQSHQAASLGEARLRPAVEEAQRSERQRVSATHEAEQSSKTHQLALQRHAGAKNSVVEAERAVTQGQEELARRAQVRDEVSQHEALAAALPKLQTQASALQAQRAGASREQVSIAQAEEAAAAQRDALAGREARHQHALLQGVAPLREAAESAAAKLVELVGAEEPDAVLDSLHREALAAQERGSRLEQAAEALERRADAERAVGEAEQLVAQERVASTGNAAARQALERERNTAAEEVALSDRVLAPLERVALYAEQREALEPGDECPLCGSTEHPHAGQAAAVAQELELARQARSEAENARALLDTQLGEAVTAGAAISARLEGALAALAKAAADQLRQAARVSELLVDSGLEPSATLADVHEAQRALAASAGVRRERREALQAAQSADRAAGKALLEAERALQAEGEALAGERARCEQQATNLAERRAQHEEREAEVAVLTASLLADLQAAGVPSTEVEAGLQQAAEWVATWREAVEAVAQAERSLEALHTAQRDAVRASEVAEVAVAEAAEKLTMREADLAKATVRHAQAREALAEAWDAVDGGQRLLEGESFEALSPGELLRRQEARVQQLHGVLRAAMQARTEADRAHTETLSRLAEQRQHAADIDVELTSLSERLLTALAELHLADREALVVRRLDPVVQRSSQALRDRLRSEKAALQGREQAYLQEQERLRSSRPAELDEEVTTEQLAARLEELSARQVAVGETVQAARSVVDHASRQAEALAAAQRVLGEAREKAEVWRELSRLIGTNQGEAFKQFAQALNLDQLLLRANRHLSTLSPRYQLHTLKNEDTGLPTLEFEVADAWRPGTTRSLKTLSGGESFLVSLALALGLSDLRTRSMPVETLLLDEGFGTLDPDTLKVALAALQQLQQSGRQVGIISHVVGLEEQIPARILVEPIGGGHSRVRTENAEGGLR